MEIEINHQSKLATVWLSQAERDNPAVNARLDALCRDCKSKKYMVAIFQSGSQELTDQTSGLLIHNRRRAAQIAGRGM